MKLLPLLLLFPLLTGCASTVPTLPLVACGVDFADNRYTLTLEGVHQNSLEGEACSVFLTTQGDSLAQAYARANAQLADTLSFAHLEVLVLSAPALAQWEDMAHFFYDTAPPDTQLALCYACTPAELLQVEGFVEPLTGLALGALLINDVPTGDWCRHLYQAPALPNLPLPVVTCTQAGRVRLLDATFQEDAHA